MRRLLLLLLGGVLGGAACRQPPTATDPPPAPSASVTAVASMAPGVTSSRVVPAPAGSAPMSEAEAQRAKRYQEALARGRMLTQKEDLAGAMTAFDEALQALPGDARALGERGFARLQTGDLDGAESDFYAALDRKPERAVLAATTYNLALVAERRGNKALADELREAARASRMPGRPACDAFASRGKQIADTGELRTLMTLRQVRDALVRDGGGFNPPLPTSDEEAVLAKEMLGGQPGPWRFSTEVADHLLFGRSGDYRLRLYVSDNRSGRCGGTTSRKVEMPDGANPVVTHDTSMYQMRAVCSGPLRPGSDEVHLHTCNGTPGEESAGLACLDPLIATHDVTVYDRVSGEPLLSVSQSRSDRGNDARPWPASERVQLVPRADGVQLLGGGCNRFEPFVKVAPAKAPTRP